MPERRNGMTEQEEKDKIARARQLAERVDVERAERARQAAQEKEKSNEAAKNSERHCLFKKSQAAPAQPQAAATSTKASAPVLKRRPSFGSTSARF
jgi:hypothetical protein